MTTPIGAADPSRAVSKPLTVCLVGMPNSGKTTLMNALTGGHFHTANYPGVTVSLLQGKSAPKWGSLITFVDLPGVHSSVNPSPDESCHVASLNRDILLSRPMHLHWSSTRPSWNAT